jgi:hypothetical protein
VRRRLVVLPFVGIYTLAEVNSISLDTTNTFIVAGVIEAIDAALLLGKATFRREGILTKWK